jgi:diaminopimelate decarboxylase
MGNQQLLFDGCNMVEMAKKYGTPVYVMSETAIVERCEEIRRDFLERYPNTRAVFASKAFQTLEICRIVTREGLGIDAVSGGEIYTAYKAGVPMEHVYFHGNNKSLEEIRMAVDYNIGRVVVDNMYELEALNENAREKNKVMQILFRITPGVDSHTHKFISTGQLDSKFGIPLDIRVRNDYISKAMEMSNIELKGFHFHVGSQLEVNDSHMAALGIAIDLIRDVKNELGFEALELNIGGGFGIHYVKGDERAKIKEFMDPIMSELQQKCDLYELKLPQVTIEPGRWIVGEAGITLYTIGSVKEIPDIRKYVGIDGGMPDNPRPGLYDAKYGAVIANKYGLPANEKVTIAGKCCESSDILIWDIDLPKAESGDILAVFSTGAYNYSMASNYNRITRPPVIMVKDGQDRLVVKRESYDDLIVREL